MNLVAVAGTVEQWGKTAKCLSSRAVKTLRGMCDQCGLFRFFTILDRVPRRRFVLGDNSAEPGEKWPDKEVVLWTKLSVLN